MQSLTLNQRRYLTALTLLTVVCIAYLVMLLPGAASAEPRREGPEATTSAVSPGPLLRVDLDEVRATSY